MKEILWTMEEAAHAVGAAPTADWQAYSVSIDSRSVKPGDLFIALRGEKFDGHDFIAQAFEQGAVAAIVDHAVATDKPLLIVRDTVQALEALGKRSRERTHARIIAVTGSVGKTSTKEMLKSALEVQGMVFASTGNLNNHFGVPLSLARMPRDTDFGIFELGMNHAGEISSLTRQVRPHAAIISTVEAVHLEFFDSVESIADAKAEIFEGVEPEGAVILNRDNPHYERLIKHAKSHKNISTIYSFGTSDDAIFRLVAATHDEQGLRVTASCGERSLTYKLNLLGTHQALNSVGVLAAVQAVGANIDQAIRGFNSLSPQQGRGKEHIIKLPNGPCLVIDDTYNASAASITAALAVLRERANVMGGKAIAVLGDMLELGRESSALHRSLATPVTANRIDRVYTVGSFMKELHDSLPAPKQGGNFTHSDDVALALVPHLSSGDVILVKGSRGMKMEKVVNALLEQGTLTAGLFKLA